MLALFIFGKSAIAHTAGGDIEALNPRCVRAGLMREHSAVCVCVCLCVCTHVRVCVRAAVLSSSAGYSAVDGVSGFGRF